MKKRALSLILAAVMVCALLPTVALADTVTPSGSHYADVPTDAWYAEAVNAMTEGGLFTGYSDGLFHPDDPVTFAQVAVVLCRVMGLETANPADVPEGTHWAQTAWDNISPQYLDLKNKITELGYYIINYGEYERTFYDINDNIPRGKVLETMVRLARNMTVYNASRHYEPKDEYDHVEFEFEQISPKIWTKKDIPDWNDDWVKPTGGVMGGNAGINGYLILLAYNIGITNGVDKNGTCNAYTNVSRAQLCQFLWNMGITRKGSVEDIKDKLVFTSNLAFNDPIIYRHGSLLWEDTFKYSTKLQFYKTCPNFTDYDRPVCKDAYRQVWNGQPKLEAARLCGCEICTGDGKPEDIERWEAQKQAAYDAHDQWLKEFEGTRQWEIATGKL